MIASDFALKFFETAAADNQVSTFLKIANQGEAPIGRGWRLYFSLGLTPCDDTLLRKVLIDGRYGYLEPTHHWQTIAPRTSHQFQVESWLFSGMRLITRQGFFLTQVNERGEESFLGEPTTLAPELQDLVYIRNTWIPDMTPGVRITENEPPKLVPIEQTTIPAIKSADFSGAKISLKDLEVNTCIEPSVKGYEMEITDKSIDISARSEADAFYAKQSLQQLRNQKLDVPIGKVSDSADFEHRALFIDIARHFHDGAQIKKIIEAMSRYKMNRLQLGISNDEGWRLEIDGLPELTDIGARRSRHGPIYPSWGDGPEEVSGFLSQSEFVELLQFAAERHVTIIPEFNLPGHANALLRALDKTENWQLTDPDDTSEYRSAQGYSRNVVNVGLTDTYRLAEHIISAVRALYDEADVPLSFLHLGGDEVPMGAWLESPACQSLQVWDPNWDTSNPDDQAKATAALMSYHYEQMVSLVERASPGTTTGFWHEMALHGDDRSYYNVWLTDQGDRTALDHILEQGFSFVISNASHLYLDMPYTLGMREPGLPWANYVDTEDIYHFDPQANWDLDAHANVIGIQAQLWTETVFTSELLDYYLFPRLLAVAERAWNAQPDPGSWPAFYTALSETEMNHLLELGIQPRPLKAQA